MAEPTPTSPRGYRDDFRASIVVIESRPAWAPDLQRCLVNQRILVRRHLPWPEPHDVVPHAEPIVIVIDLAADPGGCLTWLSRQQRRQPSTPVIVLAGKAAAALQWIVLELGATLVLPEWRSAGDVAHLCRRLLARD